VRLYTILADRFPQIEAHYYNIDILRVPKRKLLNMVYAWAIERVPHDKIEEWERELVDLLPWQDGTSEAAEQAESDSFFAMMNKGG
jgi:hypothetical protein